jgi:hypothetical protein
MPASEVRGLFEASQKYALNAFTLVVTTGGYMGEGATATWIHVSGRRVSGRRTGLELKGLGRDHRVNA